MDTTTKTSFALLICISLAATLAGCELESEYEDGDTIGGDSYSEVEELAEIPDYRYVRIDDLSTKSDTIDGGADIDAVILSKTSGEIAFAVGVEGFQHGGGRGDDLDPTKALGAPDSFYRYYANDMSVCDVDGNGFVSLGGGSLVLEMGDVIASGDTLSVLEVGGCEYDDAGHEAIVEPVRVSISVASDLYQPYWYELGSKEGPEISFTIPDLVDPTLNDPYNPVE